MSLKLFISCVQLCEMKSDIVFYRKGESEESFSLPGLNIFLLIQINLWCMSGGVSAFSLRRGWHQLTMSSGFWLSASGMRGFPPGSPGFFLPPTSPQVFWLLGKISPRCECVSMVSCNCLGSHPGCIPALYQVLLGWAEAHTGDKSVMKYT